MNTPIYDFVTSYSNQKASRMHMPGHKGVDSLLGIEHLDITEFDGADNLWEANGIIAESESNASALFGCPTFYSTEGSSLAIRGMLFLIKKWSAINGSRPLILAARNAHKTFIYTAAILDLEIDWLMQKASDSYQSCSLTAEDVRSRLEAAGAENRMPAALYLTSPDYLGNITDIESIAKVCHHFGVFLLVDNAHGAYLKFISEGDTSLHPIDLGADMCCDSAHKTLPVLTGGAYLHVRCSSDDSTTNSENIKNNEDSDLDDALIFFRENAKSAMALFGSTSPSYLIMQSLDLCNAYLSENASAYEIAAKRVADIKDTLEKAQYTLKGNEPIKITIDAKAYGYSGDEVAQYLLNNNNIYVEHHDEDYVVMMITPQTSDEELSALSRVLKELPRILSSDRITNKVAAQVNSEDARVPSPEQSMSYMEAILSKSETIPSSKASGRILAEAAVSTPPCVPLFMCGERINAELPEGEVRVVIE